ncbi:P-type ATPase [Truncatella angustata]|uniref:P-type ATPase n=1 Tax=Truncatella angustata TaxID=152316 RepID=A0A9P8UJ92_9PEZI|nr:P-type ATPase [Truncatella angustata]KAH6653136.1 P-type ATPase [Truncatella angustata]
MVVWAAWIPAIGSYMVESSNEPFNPKVGAIRFDSRSPKDIDFRKVKEGSSGGTIVAASQLLEESTIRLQEFLSVDSLANLAIVHGNDGTWHAHGDPTEIAIQVFAHRFTWSRRTMVGQTAEWKELAELPFDREVKRMSDIMQQNSTGQKWVFTKGAVERIIGACTGMSLTSSSISSRN